MARSSGAAAGARGRNTAGTINLQETTVMVRSSGAAAGTRGRNTAGERGTTATTGAPPQPTAPRTGGACRTSAGGINLVPIEPPKVLAALPRGATHPMVAAALPTEEKCGATMAAMSPPT